MVNISRLSCIAAACMTVSLAPLTASAKVVGEPALTAACAKEAAHRLAMDQSQVLTLPTELTKGNYYVYAQVSREDGSLIMVECKFDGKKHFTTISIDGKAYKVSGSTSGGSSAAATGGAPKAATAACLKQMGGPSTVQQVSQLRPGFHEIIIKETNTGRRVACTVSDNGNLEDWVEMN